MIKMTKNGKKKNKKQLHRTWTPATIIFLAEFFRAKSPSIISFTSQEHSIYYRYWDQWKSMKSF